MGEFEEHAMIRVKSGGIVARDIVSSLVCFIMYLGTSSSTGYLLSSSLLFHHSARIQFIQSIDSFAYN